MWMRWMKDSSDALIMLRWVVIAVAPLMLVLSGDIDPVTVGILGGAVLYTLLLSRHIRARGQLPVWALALDLIIISAVIYVRDPLQTDGHLFYYLVIIMAGMSHGMKGSLVACAATICLYSAASMLAGTPPEFLARLALRSIYFVLFAWLSGFVALLEHRQRDAVAIRERALAELEEAHKELEEYARTVRNMAYRDVLTGLPNRRRLYEELAERLEASPTGEDLALIFVDLDRFKRINDALGHHVGDGLLVDIGQRLERTLGERGLVARLGGDEFAVLLADVTDRTQAAQVAEELLGSLNVPFQVVEHELYVTASIGVAMSHGKTEARSLLKEADVAMSRGVKAQGRNSFRFYTAALDQDDDERLHLMNSLRRALEHEELRLHYQPQLNLTTGRVDTLEALLRWQREDGALVAPGRFIQLAEESGLILPIGAWVLQEACRQLRQWHDDGWAHLTAAINISAYQFQLQKVPEMVGESLSRHGIPPESLTIELAETALLQETEAAHRRLHRLNEMGVQVALDDFGVGYSSLAYLRQLPVDIIKLDQSFVLDLTRNATDATIAAAVIEMAHALDLHVVAEGVENTATTELLRSLGCDAIQGFSFSKPLAPQQVPDFLSQLGDGLRRGRTY